MSLAFVGSLTAPAGTPIPVTVYDGVTLVALDPAVVTWSAMPAGVTVTPSATGFVFASTVVRNFSATATSGISTGIISVNFTAPPLKFTSP